MRKMEIQNISTIQVFRIISLSVLFHLISLNISCQSKFAGEYVFVNSDFGIYQEMHLIEDGRFIYNHGSDLGSKYFYGNWYIRNDKVFFKVFKKPKVKTSSYQNWCNVEDTTSSIHLYLYDDDNTPLFADGGVNLRINEDSIVRLRSECNEFIIRPEDFLYLGSLTVFGENVKVKYHAAKGNCIHIYYIDKGEENKKKVDSFPLKGHKLKIENDMLVSSRGKIFTKTSK